MQFRRQDGAFWLEVIYRDGLTRRYSAGDWRFLSEEQGPVPDLSLSEGVFDGPLLDRFAPVRHADG